MSTSKYAYRSGFFYGMLLACTLQPSAITAQNAPFTREDAVRIALEHNPEVKAARQVWEGAKAQARQAGALPDPELEIEFEELPDLGSVTDFGERSIGVVQTLEFPLKWWQRRKAAGQQAEAIRLKDFEVVRREVALRAQMAYDRFVLQQHILQYARQNLDLTQAMLGKAQIRFEAGDVAPLEVVRVEVEEGRATNQVNLAQNELLTAQAEFNTLLGRPLNAPLFIADSLAFQPITADLDHLKGLALQHRPDVLGNRQHATALHAQETAAAAAYVPDLNVGVFRQRLQDGALTEDFWRLSFSLEVPLWAFSRQRAERAEARAEKAQAEAEQEVLHNQVLLDTERAYREVITAQEQVSLFKEQILPVAERAFEVANRSYSEGKATYLELLDARRTLTETQIDYLQALFGYRVAKAQLAWAIASPLPR